MTAIQGYIKPNRRPGELGVHSLDHFHFNVPDLSVAQNFYGEFGLDLEAGANKIAMRTFGTRQVWGTIGEGSRKKLGYLSFGAFEDDIDRFAERMKTLGLARIDPPPGVDSTACGCSIPMACRSRSRPRRKHRRMRSPTSTSRASAPDCAARLRTPMSSGPVPPAAHVLIFTRDVKKSIEFYVNVLGMRLSDRSGYDIAFLHGIHGSDHHMIALGRSNAPGHHHFSWDVGSLDEIGAGDKHMLDKGFEKGWGLGRHVLGRQRLPLRSRPLGQLLRIFRRHRLCPGLIADWPVGGTIRPGIWSTSGARIRRADFVHNYEAE